MNKQQVELAIGSGLELLGDKSEVAIPTRLNDGIFFLKQLLHLIASGQMGLQPTVQTQEPPLDGLPPDAIPPIGQPNPGTPDKKKRAANRKKRKKVSKKN